MSNTTTIYGVIALFAVGMIFSSPLTASVAAVPYPDDNHSYLELKKAIVDIQSDPEGDVITDIVFKTRGEIPKLGSGENFGYGVITLVDGSLNVIATTSHPNLGIVDSELQQDVEDPVFHNHYVLLGTDAVNCGVNEEEEPNLSVTDLSFESPGEIFIKGNAAILKNLPPSAEGQLTGAEITPGSNITLVASFLLESVFDEQGELAAVCVTDVMPIEPIDERTVIFGEKDFKPDYPRPNYENHDEGYEYANENEYSNEMSYDRQYDYNQRY
jgi:hypothetical protein